jgi:hypothetical protein
MTKAEYIMTKLSGILQIPNAFKAPASEEMMKIKNRIRRFERPAVKMIRTPVRIED